MYERLYRAWLAKNLQEQGDHSRRISSKPFPRDLWFTGVIPGVIGKEANCRNAAATLDWVGDRKPH
jgi:hypothetical protein